MMVERLLDLLGQDIMGVHTLVRQNLRWISIAVTATIVANFIVE